MSIEELVKKKEYKLDKEQKIKLIQYLQEGVKQRWIAKKLNVSQPLVCWYSRKLKS